MFIRSATTRRCKIAPFSFRYHSSNQQPTFERSLSSDKVMQLENTYSAHNYHPLNVVFAKAKGVDVWDPEGKHYYDFLSAYSAVNQGHCHPKIVAALKEQADQLTLSSRAFYNNVFGQWAKFVTELFGYDMVLPMNTGAEGVETAMKMARRWGYMRKNIPEGEAIIIACSNNFHGRTISVISMSTSQDSKEHFGPYTPGLLTVKYNNVDSLKRVLEEFGPKVCAFIVEPIQGEAGVVVPDSNYLKDCYDLCKKHNVLFISDEIQTGIGRTGKMLCTEWSGFKPDAVILGKALGGGVYPISCVLADKPVMSVFEPGTHGSTFGGNPLGCAVSIASLQVILEENLIEKARVLGEMFRNETKELTKDLNGKPRLVQEVRGMGLLNAFVLNSKHDSLRGKTGYDICKLFKTNGLLAKQTHDYIIRFAPPLVITEQQLKDCIEIIKSTVLKFEAQQ